MGEKHTPGPWVVDSGNGTACYIRPADHEPGVMAVAQVCKRGWSEKQANARLIAAAPEMLAALKDALDALIQSATEARHIEPTKVVIRAAVDKADAAIQKATGGAV